jgi:hypothetical protein
MLRQLDRAAIDGCRARGIAPATLRRAVLAKH